MQVADIFTDALNGSQFRNLRFYDEWLVTQVEKWTAPQYLQLARESGSIRPVDR